MGDPQETVTAGVSEANGGQSLEHAMSEVDLGFANDALPVSSSPGQSMHGTKCEDPDWPELSRNTCEHPKQPTMCTLRLHPEIVCDKQTSQSCTRLSCGAAPSSVSKIARNIEVG